MIAERKGFNSKSFISYLAQVTAQGPM